MTQRHETLPPFLADGTTAYLWAMKNTNIGDKIKESSTPEYNRVVVQELRRRAAKYSEFASNMYANEEIQVIRVLAWDSKDDIRLDGLQKRWTIRHAVEEYQEETPKYYGPKKPYSGLVEAVIGPSDIEWEVCFDSFMYFGFNEWDVSLVPESPVTVLSVNGVPFDKPLIGKIVP